MTYRLSEIPSGRTRRWIRRKEKTPVPWFVRPLIIILSLILIGTLAWQGAQYALHGRQGAAESFPNAQMAPAATEASGWERDVGVSLDEAVRHASEGDVTQTEVAVDRATSVLTIARLRSQQTVPPDFFDTVLAQFDQILSAYHENSRLTEHVTLARIELAQLRSATDRTLSGTTAGTAASTMASAPASSTSSLKPEDVHPPGAPAEEAKSETATQPNPAAKDANQAAPKHIVMRAPRALTEGATLDPGSLGGNVLDATGMPSASEVLEPPSSRLFSDNVRVENVTVAGATQTIDGVHWKNVTFIGTRLRYEGGELDLHNVRFIHCLFGFTSDERGARIATAIARGEGTIVID
jgi:hypothetical protein